MTMEENGTVRQQDTTTKKNWKKNENYNWLMLEDGEKNKENVQLI